jgi:hypothetical protein
MRRWTQTIVSIAIAAQLTFAQGLNTPAAATDWEEINFDFDSSVLVDGFPSLLRLAELLKANPGYRVRLEGYTDGLGNNAYNQNLGMARANTVRDFLSKYGANATQISTSTRGEAAPRVSNQGATYRRTDEARYMNRRVSVTVTDAQGRTIGAGSAGDAIRAITGQTAPGTTTSATGDLGPATASQVKDCCDQIMKRLDRLDDVAAMLRDLAVQNAELRREVDALRQSQQALQTTVTNGVAGANGGRGGPIGAAAGANAGTSPGGNNGGGGGPGAAGSQTAAVQPGGRGGVNNGVNSGGAVGAVGGNNAGTAAVLGGAGRGGLQTGANPTADEIAAALSSQLKRDGLAVNNANNSSSIFNGGSNGIRQNIAINGGLDNFGNPTVNGRGTLFTPIGNNFGLQAQGDYYYMRGQKEGQFDLGLVDRLGSRAQIGFFGSAKTLFLNGNQNAGTLAQASFLVDYFFGRGRVGGFATKAFRDNQLINRVNGVGADGNIQRNVIQERYLNVVDQLGVSTAVGLLGNTYAQANIAYLRSNVSANRAGGGVRFVLPMNDRFAFTIEGGVNETLLPGTGRNQGRAAVGFQVGNFLRPKEYLAAAQAVPMEIPRVRYETVERTVRTGNDAPIADAGPDLSNVAAGPVQLDGSLSRDPDGDPISFQWIQESGPLVGVSNALTSKAGFVAAAGQIYVFRLNVRDDHGAQNFDRVQIATTTIPQVRIVSFQSDPRTINGTETTTLSWRVENADSINIEGIGPVPASGSRQVTPTSTTTYVMTARNSVSQDTATTTVTLNQAKFQFCFASPATIVRGESATLTWATSGASGVRIAPGIGNATASGNLTVRPEADTTYTLTTVGGASTDSCTIQVQVTTARPNNGQAPVIVRFSADPSTIDLGQSSTLQWSVEGADKVTISGLGDVPTNSTRDVTPATTTTYTLTATNAAGTSTARALVTVIAVAPPEIISFTARPATFSTPFSPVDLTCRSTGTVTLRIAHAQFLTPDATMTVYPSTDTEYTCIGTNSKGQTATKTLLVKQGPPDKPTVPPGPPPAIRIQGGTHLRTLTRLLSLDASQTTGLYRPLTFAWTTTDAVAIGGANTSTPSLTLGFEPRIYRVTLTVTDSRGISASQVIEIELEATPRY